jgi:two-component system NtrC family sensor kinase
MAETLPRNLVEWFAAALNDLPDAVRLIDKQGKLLHQNAASQIMAPDGLGHLCHRSSAVPDLSCPACQLEAVLERGTFMRWYVTVPLPNQPPDYFEVTLSPVRDSHGRILGVLEMLRDVTTTLGLENYLINRAESQDDEIRQRSAERDRLSSELGDLREIQTGLLERDRLAALNQLVAGIAHEINTPLGAMLSNADMLNRNVDRLRSMTDDQEKAVLSRELVKRLDLLQSNSGLVIEGANRIQAVVRTLRLFSNLDEAALKSIDLHEGLDTSLGLLQYRMGRRIEVVKHYGELPLLLCRPEALNQACMNILLNAVLAIEGAGRITITTTATTEEVTVVISDTGVGIPAENLSQVFDLGFTTRGGVGGVGIGLALTARTVREHGGKLWVLSEPGQGTTFTMRLPLSNANQKQHK